MHYIKLLSDCGKDDVALVGGKGAALGELIHIGIPVPLGFAVTTDAYRLYAKDGMSVECKAELHQAFLALEIDRVAVRSSATMEDSSTASWAGQLESYLNVDANGLEDAVLNCWQSMKSARVEKYQEENNPANSALAVAVVVQNMVQSDVSGVCFTANPVSNDRAQIVIEACRGLGELLVQGSITPENYIVDKTTSQILSYSPSNQKTMLNYTEGKQQEVVIPEGSIHGRVLSDENISKLTRLAKLIEDHFGKPQDIEWAIEQGSLYIVQSRPITTLS